MTASLGVGGKEVFKRIGLFGGTFDPVHKGHLALARSALKGLNLDRVIFIPVRRSPFKPKISISGSAHRLKMLRLSLRGMKKCAVSDCEIRRPGPSYTVDTVRKFRKKYPRGALFLILGSDALAGFKRWKNWKEILNLCVLAVGRRKGTKGKAPRGLEKKIVFLKPPMPNVSSTEVRKAQEKGKSFSVSVPKPVQDYIREKGLYEGRSADHFSRPLPRGRLKTGSMNE